MAVAIEQLTSDQQPRSFEMKSLQPYSTTDEYLYAMKEDLADWFSNMYPEWRPITADNFLECLENGVLLCQHANNVNNAARKTYSLKLATRPLTSTLENCKYRVDARRETFSARDNVSQFIKWARRVVGVHEVLMFESDDLILRKNEKNFLLCLLEVARYGARFGVSVPVIIELEDEIEREIERDKQTEIMSFTELRRLHREENIKNASNSSTHGKYSRLLKFVRNEYLDTQDHRHNHHDTSKHHSYNTFSFSHSNGANWLRQRISRIPKFTHHTGKKRQNSGEAYDSIAYNDSIPTITPNKEHKIPQISRTLGEGENRVETPAASSQLHKTVVQMASSCCCAQRFPVIRLGEGKYRIGESGTIIFIRILRYHVMVRVGGGWDTLENYLNKHDPCRHTGGHRRIDSNEQCSDTAILAVPNNSVQSHFQKMPPNNKSLTMRTEDYPLSKPKMHDTNLTNAQLIITRDADGRHHIGQITYKSEENLNQSYSCPHHDKPPSPVPKVKSVRGTGHLTSSLAYNKTSSTIVDQDISSYSPTVSVETKSINAFKNEKMSIPHDDIESTAESNSKTKIIRENCKENQPTKTKFIENFGPCFSESFTEVVDDYASSTIDGCEHDFDISDVEDALQMHNHDADATNIDEDSLESSEGILEHKEEPTIIRTVSPELKPMVTKVKPGGICTALYLAQKQKQAAACKKSTSPFTSPRANTLPSVSGFSLQEDSIISMSHRTTPTVTQRSYSIDLFNKNFLNDTSRLDRDSGFDEHDFRGERSHSSYDDNSSVSSTKSGQSSINRSQASDLNGQIYRENKAFELRLKALDGARNSNDREAQDLKTNLGKNSYFSSVHAHDTVQPTIHKYRKNSQPQYYLRSEQL